jgi:hypothetical protein
VVCVKSTDYHINLAFSEKQVQKKLKNNYGVFLASAEAVAAMTNLAQPWCPSERSSPPKFIVIGETEHLSVSCKFSSLKAALLHVIGFVYLANTKNHISNVGLSGEAPVAFTLRLQHVDSSMIRIIII